MSACSLCGGTGTVYEAHEFGGALVDERLTCPHCLGEGHDGAPDVTQPIDLIQMLQSRAFVCNDCVQPFHIVEVTRTMEGGNFYVRFACECGVHKALVPRGTVQAGVQEIGKLLYREVERTARPLGKKMDRSPMETIEKYIKSRIPEPSAPTPVDKMDSKTYAQYMREKRARKA